MKTFSTAQLDPCLAWEPNHHAFSNRLLWRIFGAASAIMVAFNQFVPERGVLARAHGAKEEFSHGV